MEKKLILDYSKWRCGGTGNNQLGKGSTRLLNYDGFMCCLGQFSPQLNPEITPNDMISCSTPSSLSKRVELLTAYGFYNSDLTCQAISINDAAHTTPVEKIASLKELFGRYGYEIEVINQPI